MQGNTVLILAVSYNSLTRYNTISEFAESRGVPLNRFEERPAQWGRIVWTHWGHLGLWLLSRVAGCCYSELERKVEVTIVGCGQVSSAREQIVWMHSVVSSNRR